MADGKGKTRRRGLEFTERDGEALTWMGEQYGARLDVLAVLLGRLGGRAEPLSVWGVRNQVDRWLRMRLVYTERALGGTWVSLTRNGLERTGVGYDVWKMPASRLAHCHAVNGVRLAYEGTAEATGRPWISERATWRERAGQRWHVPDGVLRAPEAEATDRSVAVEIELTLKTPSEYRREVIGNLRRGTAVVWYFTPGGGFGRRLEAHVAAAVQAERADVKYMVRPLPAVPGITYMGKAVRDA